jgi:hypothetical protein
MGGDMTARVLASGRRLLGGVAAEVLEDGFGVGVDLVEAGLDVAEVIGAAFGCASTRPGRRGPVVKYYGNGASSTRTQRLPPPPPPVDPEPAAASQLVPLVRHRIIIEVPDCLGTSRSLVLRVTSIAK